MTIGARFWPTLAIGSLKETLLAVISASGWNSEYRQRVDVVVGPTSFYTVSTKQDPLLVQAKKELGKTIPKIKNIRDHWEQDVLVLTVEGDFFTLDEIEAIVDLQWDLMDRFSGRYLHVEIRDGFNR